MRMTLFFVFFATLLPLAAWAQPRPFQTARLQSTGGAGVGAVLVTEAAVLNPAPLAFFTDTFASYQKTTSSVRSKNSDRVTDGRALSRTNRQESYFVFDNGGTTKGGISYQQQRENGFQRDRVTATTSTVLTPQVAVGVLYRHTEDARPPVATAHRHKVSHSVVLGATWLAHEKVSFGAVWEDVGRALPGESRVTAGLQYNVLEKTALLIDGGVNPDKSGHHWRAAVQFHLFADVFVRAGRFQDETISQEGFGWGASWSGPKVGADFAVRESREMDGKKGYLYPREKLVDVTFAVNLRF
jgi:hypothetical protein